MHTARITPACWALYKQLTCFECLDMQFGEEATLHQETSFLTCCAGPAHLLVDRTVIAITLTDRTGPEVFDF